MFVDHSTQHREHNQALNPHINRHLHHDIHGEWKKRVHTSSKIHNGSGNISEKTAEPFTFDLPGKGNGALIIEEKNWVATIVNDENFVGKALIYDLGTGKPVHEFKFNNNIMDIFRHGDILFVKPFNGWNIKAWNLTTGQPLELPETWKGVDHICFSDHYIVHNNYTNWSLVSTEAQQPIVLQISDPKTLKPIAAFKTGVFEIRDMVIDNDQLYLCGIDENSTTVTDYESRSGCLTRYDNILDQNCDRHKVSFRYDYNGGYEHSLNVQKGTVFNSAWAPSVTTLWDAATLHPLLEKKVKGGAMTAVLDNAAVIIDDAEMAICRKEGDRFSIVKTIEWDKKESANCIEIFNFFGKFSAEGYPSGIVRVRNFENYGLHMELKPPRNMRDVLHTQFINDKLLVQYNNPSDDGTFAIVWDLKTQAPSLFITRDALKGKDYKSQEASIHIYGNDIVVRSEGEFMVYKGVI